MEQSAERRLLSKRQVCLYYEDFKYQGYIHCPKELSLLAELNKRDRFFMPMSDVVMSTVEEDDEFRNFGFFVFRKAGVEFAVNLEERDVDHVQWFSAEEEKGKDVSIFLETFKIQGRMKMGGLRLVDLLNREDIVFFPVYDPIVFFKTDEGKLVRVPVGFASQKVLYVNKQRVRLILPFYE